MESKAGFFVVTPLKKSPSTRSLVKIRARTFMIELHLVDFGSWSYGPSNLLTTTCLIRAYCIGSRNSKGGNDNVHFGFHNFWKYLVTTWIFAFRAGLIDLWPYQIGAIFVATRCCVCGALDFSSRRRVLGVLSLRVWRSTSWRLHLAASFYPFRVENQYLLINPNGVVATLTGVGIFRCSYIPIWMFLCRCIAISFWCSFTRFTHFFAQFRFFGVSTLSLRLCLSRYIPLFEEFKSFGSFHVMSRSS